MQTLYKQEAPRKDTLTDGNLALSSTQLNSLAEAFRLLGDPNRLRIIMYCADSPKSVGDIAGKLELAQTLVSHHLRLLRGARLLVGNRQAKNVFYSIADRHVGEMIFDMAIHFKEGGSFARWRQGRDKTGPESTDNESAVPGKRAH